MLMGDRGTSFPSHGTAPTLWITSIPVLIRPKTVCLPSSQGVGASVMKNYPHHTNTLSTRRQSKRRGFGGLSLIHI